MNTATYLGPAYGRWTGDARQYRLSAPARFGWREDDSGVTEHVIVSATHAMYTGPETYIFPADAEGNLLEWSEMEGSYRGGLDHAEALRRAGYVVLEEVDA